MGSYSFIVGDLVSVKQTRGEENKTEVAAGGQHR